MATTTHKTEGAVHAHVSSPILYAAVLGALITLTILTVAQSYAELGKLNLVAVVLIASLKAALVVSFFMHLRWDNKFNALVFITAVFFIGVFFAYTLNDTDRRGELDADQNVKILPSTGKYAPGGFEPATPATGGAPSPKAPATAATPAAGAHH